MDLESVTFYDEEAKDFKWKDESECERVYRATTTEMFSNAAH